MLPARPGCHEPVHNTDTATTAQPDYSTAGALTVSTSERILHLCMQTQRIEAVDCRMDPFQTNNKKQSV